MYTEAIIAKNSFGYQAIMFVGSKPMAFDTEAISGQNRFGRRKLAFESPSGLRCTPKRLFIKIASPRKEPFEVLKIHGLGSRSYF